MDSVGGLPGIIGFVASLATLVGPFDSYTNAPLHWRLLVAGIACASALWALSEKLAPWVKPPPGSGVMGRPPKWSFPNFALCSFLLLVVAGCFVVFASILLIDRLTFQLLETSAPPKSSALLIAPHTKVQRVALQLPSYSTGKCEAADNTPHEDPKPQLLMLDWNSTTPVLQIDEFEYPQRVRISCNGASAIVSVTADPTSTAIYRAGDLRLWRVLSVTVGGIIWLVAMLRLWFLSR